MSPTHMSKHCSISLCCFRAPVVYSTCPHTQLLSYLVSCHIPIFFQCLSLLSSETKRLLAPKELLAYTTPSLSALTSHATIGVLVHVGNPFHQASLEGIHLPAPRIIHPIQTLVEGHCVLYELILCLLLHYRNIYRTVMKLSCDFILSSLFEKTKVLPYCCI